MADAITRRTLRRRATAMTESDFIAIADRTLERIGKALDAALESSDADVDWSLNDGILEIDCEDGGKLIINRHVPNREIWLAARSGGFHFRIDAGRWRDTRSGRELADEVTRLVREQSGVQLAIDDLPAA
jgi:CyaY protein